MHVAYNEIIGRPNLSFSSQLYGMGISVKHDDIVIAAINALVRFQVAI